MAQICYFGFGRELWEGGSAGIGVERSERCVASLPHLHIRVRGAWLDWACCAQKLCNWKRPGCLKKPGFCKKGLSLALPGDSVSLCLVQI